jgi:hypothetical protein
MASARRQCGEKDVAPLRSRTFWSFGGATATSAKLQKEFALP